MIIQTYTCDKCKKPIKDSGEGVYCISHQVIAGNPIWGDNRIPRDIQFCKDCFGEHLAPLIIIKI